MEVMIPFCYAAGCTRDDLVLTLIFERHMCADGPYNAQATYCSQHALEKYRIAVTNSWTHGLCHKRLTLARAEETGPQEELTYEEALDRYAKTGLTADYERAIEIGVKEQQVAAPAPLKCLRCGSSQLRAGADVVTTTPARRWRWLEFTLGCLAGGSLSLAIVLFFLLL